MADTHPTPDEQWTLWNGAAGHVWVEEQELLDEMFRPFEDLLVEAAAGAVPDAVLDVGCGTGTTTLAVARRLGSSTQCIGIDISQPMIVHAQARAEREGTRVRFIQANAQDYPLESHSVDMIISRFGVMFFDDPVFAFTNLRRATREEGHLQVIAWRDAAENPFMTTAERAAAPLLPRLPPRRPDEPGQFAFADRSRVWAILHESGWTDIDIRSIDVTCTIRASQLLPYVTRLGKVGAALRETDDSTRAQVVDTIRPAFDSYVQGDEVRFTAACWSIGARVPTS
jgi:SAM-dependent methyltransferase